MLYWRLQKCWTCVDFFCMQTQKQRVFYHSLRKTFLAALLYTSSYPVYYTVTSRFSKRLLTFAMHRSASAISTQQCPFINHCKYFTSRFEKNVLRNFCIDVVFTAINDSQRSQRLNRQMQSKSCKQMTISAVKVAKWTKTAKELHNRSAKLAACTLPYKYNQAK